MTTTADLEVQPTTPAPGTPSGPLPASVVAAFASALAACGGGSDGSTAPAPAPAPAPPTAAEASRFLAQASMGANRAQIARVQALGYAGWLDEQFELPVSGTRWDLLVAGGLTDITYKNNEAGFDSVAWNKLLSAPDTLRQRITLALSEIFVISIDGLANGNGWKQFAAASYLELLEAGAFGSHRALLQQISLSGTMGVYLTYRGSAKANTTSGALPDENYARELMQLFTIGLLQLNPDGTPQLTGGKATETYGLDDITGLARVFTGWEFDFAGLTGSAATATPDFKRRPMVQVASRYETGAKTFLGLTIASGTDATAALTQALDKIFAHPNTAPFFSRQLIQRLVTSNPSPAYVARVAAVFNNSADRGNLGAVIRAVLLDDEARNAATAASPSFGKLREPMLRFTGWARAFNTSSPSELWKVGDTSDSAKGLAQSPLRSPSVFNFFRPGYVPPNSPLGSAALVAPEFQIANESSVVGCINFLQRAVAGSVGDLTPDYTSLTPLADDAQALLDEINLVLAANQLGATTVATLAAALQTMAGGTDVARRNRINAALVLVLAAPEFIVQK
ncbi:MAG: DUF1800 domain-containing protein [Burkholderiales bacterium]